MNINKYRILKRQVFIDSNKLNVNTNKLISKYKRYVVII